MSHLGRKFCTILWKNIILRKRHWVMTLLEIIIPTLFFYGISYVNNIANKLPDDKLRVIFPPQTEANIFERAFINHDVVNIAYTPANNFTNTIIENVKNMMTHIVKSRPYKSDNLNDNLNITSCTSEDELEKYFVKLYGNTTESNYIGYGIVFTNTDPTNFHYKLRSTSTPWNTAILFPYSGYNKDSTDQYIFQGFIALQLAVDKAFIQLVTNSTPAYEAILQQFPLEKYNDQLHSMVRNFVPTLAMICIVLFLSNLLKKIVEEKQSGIKELMKMMGLKTWMVWTGWMLNSMMVYTITSIILTFFLCYDFTGRGAVFMYTQWSLVLLMLFFFSLTSIAFSFVISAFFYRPNFAMNFCIVLLMIPFIVVRNIKNIPMILKTLLSIIIPSIGLDYCFSVMFVFEKTRNTLSWSTIFSDGVGGNGMSVGMIFIIFILDTILFTMIAWYVDSIFPGPYGRSKPWNYIFQWILPKNVKDSSDFKQYSSFDKRNFEAAPANVKVGIKIDNLRKVMPNNVVAVDDVNLDIYKGEITALLGHNGAGKTTTMSIITGMFLPTSGAVYVDNCNIFERMDDFRSSLGLCPQHNLLFTYLTVEEHLIFFGLLKDMSASEAKTEGLKLLNLMKMINKKDVLVSKLSGGMKRKLSLSIALIGNPKVLMLDEPTSGMDPESRREVWDMLLKLRGQRTIIITTHFMEEADVLGDRIAIMHHGRIQCYGTTLFLKKLYGTGYQLTIMKEHANDVDSITSYIKSSGVEAEMKSSFSGQVTYALKQEHSYMFPKLFKRLEDNKFLLGIKGMGIACTTMEEVFLKVGEIAKDHTDKTSLTSREQTLQRTDSTERLTNGKIKGISLLIQQFKCLVHKKALYSLRKWIGILGVMIFSLFMVALLMVTMNLQVYSFEKEPPLELRLSAYSQATPNTFIASNDTANPVLNQFKELVTGEGSSVNQFSGSDMVSKLVNESLSNIEYYEKHMIVAGEFNSSAAKGLYNNMPLHAVPIALNLITQSILQSNPKTSSYKIFTTNHPLNINSPDECVSDIMSLASTFIVSIMWAVFVPFAMLMLVSDFITFPLSERVCNVKQIQLMTGVPHIVYCFSMFIWDYFIFLLATVAVTLVVYFSDLQGTYSNFNALAVFILITLLFGISGIFYAYFFSYFTKTSSSASLLFVILNQLVGMTVSVIMYYLLRIVRNPSFGTVFISPWIVYTINYVLCLNPFYALVGAYMSYSTISFTNGKCDRCPDLVPPCTKKHYLSFKDEDEGLGIYLIYLSLDWILYYVLMVIIDFGYFSIMWQNIKAMWIGKNYDLIAQEDTDVKNERDIVDGTQHMNTDIRAPPALIAKGLVKKFSRRFAAVKGVSFQVARGECFGLLGVNGAGKTTTFRMLTGDEIPTSGEASILNFNLAKDRTKYLMQIGYCPQYDGINETLTGEEMLTLFALLRGIRPKGAKFQVNNWINLLGLEEYRNRLCGSYSGGNKRKLCTAIALIGDPPVVFLDEPTSGVDPISRRNLWDVLARSQKRGQAVVLTSHSMEECEALCTRLTIMVQGRMMCIGSTQYIKQKYGLGYTVMIKLFSDLITITSLNELKTAMYNIFSINCVLKDEHTGLLHYHLTDSNILLSTIFEALEKLKLKYKIIEDYTISDTTLEQVFIAFAKQAHH